MRVIEVQRRGGPEVLGVAEHPDPRPGPGQVVAEVAAAGVNYMDIYQREGVGGELDVRIGGRYPLADAALAQQDLAARRTAGKLLLIP
jgi:NADPH:quinone reductase-like Zn-dependent oxidoreductase